MSAPADRAERPEARGTLGTVRNAVLLLDLLSEGPAYQHLGDLSADSGLSVATVHRLLRSLVLADLVEQDPRSSRYGLGPGVTRLSQRYLDRLPALGALAPYLPQLRDATGHTVQVGLLVRGSTVYVDRVDGPEAGPYRDVHRVRPALETAAGRLLAARAEDAEWRLALRAADPPLCALAEKERAGWARAAHLYLPGDGDTAPEVAAVVTDGQERGVGAVTVGFESAPEPQEREAVARQLVRAASAAGRTLSHD